jgi:stringent starvation protein B
MEFTSNKPYLVRAIYDWVVDNDATPHVVIFADNPEVLVPQQFVDDGKIILNISPTAAQNLVIDKDGMSFSARFSGKPYNIFTPMNALMAVYATENGEGMSFDIEAENDTPPPEPKGPKSIDSKKESKDKKPKNNTKKKSKRPSLKVVK